MADFVEVMRQWKRLCKEAEHVVPCSCNGCPLYDLVDCSAIYETVEDAEGWKILEDEVMNWAMKNPEITWRDFLSKFDFIKKHTDADGRIKTEYCWDTPIPLEIARNFNKEDFVNT